MNFARARYNVCKQHIIVCRLHNNVIMLHKNESEATAALKQIQLRLSVLAGRQLTHSELADIAGVSVRSIGEWMRGSTTPPGIPALLRLLSSLTQEDVSAILLPWVSSSNKNGSTNHGPDGLKSPVKSRKRPRQHITINGRIP